MELDFYKGFDYVESVGVSKYLWNDILSIECLDEVTPEKSIIPEGFDGEGENIERVALLDIRKGMIIGVSRLLRKYSKLDRDKDTITSISKLVEIIRFFNDEEISHFKLDI